MEKKILISGKELEEMRTCPECGARGLIDLTDCIGGTIVAHVFDCGCGCRWKCKTEAAIAIEKESRYSVITIDEKKQKRWLTRLLNR